MLDRILRRTFRNFSTLFLMVFMIVGPLHLLYAFTFRNVIATQELHAAIEGFPNYRQVRSVGPPTLERAGLVFWTIAGLELLALPLGAAAARRVVTVDAAGGVPTATGAWRDLRGDRKGPVERPPPGSRGAAIAGGALVAIAVGVLAQFAADRLALFVAEDLRWSLVGLGQATARALGAPFFLVPLGLALAAKADPPRTPKLY